MILADALKFDQDVLNRVAGELGLELVVGFGSRVSGDPPPTEESDLDLAVLDRNAYGWEGFCAVQNGLGAVFNEFEIDLSFLMHADPYFRFEIFRNGLCLFGDPQLYFEQEAYAFKSFADSQSLQRLQRTLFEKKLAMIDRELAREVDAQAPPSPAPERATGTGA